MNDKALWSRIEAEEKRKKEADLMLNAAKKHDKTGFLSFIRDMLFGLGIRNIFYGIYDVVAITLFAAIVMLLLLARSINGLSVLGGNAYVFALAFSPIIYTGFFALTFIKEKHEGSYDVKMTCRYTAIHLCAFRMFIGGGACFLINTAAVTLVCAYTQIDFLKLLAVSFFSLFVFALVTIIALLRCGIRGFVIPVALLFGVILLLGIAEPLRETIGNLPTAAYIVAGIVIFFIEQRLLYSINRRSRNVIR